MAKIEYKSKKEQLGRTEFNPYLASIQEIEDDMEKLEELIHKYAGDLISILLEEHDTDEETKKHFIRIYTGIRGSTPFDKKIINDKNVKAVDELKLSDFKYEKNFRDCLENYYYFLLYEDGLDKDYDALIVKITDLLNQSPISKKLLLKELFKLDEEINYNNSEYNIIYYLIRKYSFNKLKNMISDAEKEIIDKKVEKSKIIAEENIEKSKNNTEKIKNPALSIKEKQELFLDKLKSCNSLEEAAEKSNIPIITVYNWYDYGEKGMLEFTTFYKELTHIINSRNIPSNKQNKSKISKENQDKAKSSSDNNKSIFLVNRQKTFLEYLKDSDSMEEAAKRIKLPIKEVNDWYNRGKQGDPEYTSFYNDVNDILDSKEIKL